MLSPIDFLSTVVPSKQPWACQSCRYVHPDPAKDVFYQEKVKNVMFICASLLLLVKFSFVYFPSG